MLLIKFIIYQNILINKLRIFMQNQFFMNMIKEMDLKNPEICSISQM